VAACLAFVTRERCHLPKEKRKTTRDEASGTFESLLFLEYDSNIHPEKLRSAHGREALQTCAENMRPMKYAS